MGRPPKYKTPEELDKAIEKYFSGGAMKVKTLKLGEEIEVPTPTISDLVLFLGFADRHSFYAYEEKKEFSNTIKKARTMITREYENLLRKQSCTGAIFALKNLGWKDNDGRTNVKIEQHTHYTNINVKDLEGKPEGDLINAALGRG